MTDTGLLSRIAETLFWTGRYVERADDTARMVDVYVHRLLEEPRTDEDSDCRALLSVLGIPQPPDSPLDIGTTIYHLAYEARTPSAIAGAVLAARAGARSVRDVISSEMWECLNVTSLALARQRRAAERLGPHVYLRFIRERAALFFGLADSTMSHDDAWRFLVLGRSIERVDMTARLLIAQLPDTPHETGWLMLLRACGAYESFIRSHGWAGGQGQAAEFLILDRLFPRSVLHALATAEECLAALDPEAGRAGMADPARRPIGVLRTRLEYSRTDLPPDQIAELLAELQQTCQQASQAITSRYFSYAEPVAWAQGSERMSWRLLIEHRTHVSYHGAARASYNEARMTPVTLPGQTVLETGLATDAQVPVWSYRDYWGTQVNAFDIQAPHDDLLITARATVETSAPGPAPAPVPWPELAARADGGRLAEFRAPTARTRVSAELAADARQRAAGLDPAAAAAAIATWVHGHVTYQQGATGVQTSAQEAWDQGKGVCQDIAHLTVALLREIGLPARYVSGYLFPAPDAEPGQEVTGQSHAWIEYWAGRWAACDPTNNAPVGPGHVVVASGRDYADVPPLKGIYHGAPSRTMDVAVTLTRLA